MRNRSFFFGVLLLVEGVFGVEKYDVTLSVMAEDSVTLTPGDIKIPEDDTIQWSFDNKIIAHMNKAAKINSISEGDDAGFKGRLKLDSQTGSLNITNIRTNDSGIYKLLIKSTTEIPKTFQVTVHAVFGVGTNGVKSVSVMKEDNVTLNTGVKVDQILWKFGDQDIIIDLNDPVDERWRNFHLNSQTGQLTIRNIQSDQDGVYKMEINTSSMNLHREFNIIISDEIKAETVKEGEPVTLHTGLIDIMGYDLTWMSKDQLKMAEIDRKTKRFSVYNTDGRFKGRLQRNENTGSLTIRDTRTSDSGDYHLKMSSGSHSLQRSISVTVKDSSLSGAASGICSAGVGLVVWALTVFLLQEV